MAAPETSRTPAPRRNRPETEKAFVSAGLLLLEKEGLLALGVNAVARAAGHDKQLLYRYFGSWDDYLSLLGRELAKRFTSALDARLSAGEPQTASALLRGFAHALIDIYRTDPLLRQLILWELQQPASQVAPLVDARSAAFRSWIELHRDLLPTRDKIDLPAFNALIIAAISHLCFVAGINGVYAGLPLASESDWERLAAIIDLVVVRTIPE
ncbi:MAG: TetR/AcrR family transcriptional regulator [Hyphomicrobiaceae bacterium]|nr:TetR/AcrR family transcriptional regulator [Hyphomicrobiaceae bacterium]